MLSEKESLNLDLNNAFEEFSWRSKEPENFKEVIMRQIETCRKELSKDLRKGGTYSVQTPQGIVPLYFPDQREVIINAVRAFRDLATFFFDDTANKVIGDIEILIEKAYEKYVDLYIQQEWVKPLRDYAIQTRTIQQDVQNPRDRPRSDVGERLEEEMKYYVLDLYRKMFRELILLFKRKNEFSMKKVLGAYD